MPVETVEAEVIPEPKERHETLARADHGVAIVAPPATTSRAMIMKQALTEASEERAILGEYVKKHMVEGSDYGKIPGTDKPTLLKPGAEKLLDLFRCTPEFMLMEKVEDFERGFFHYVFRARVIFRQTNTVVAEGYGSANAKEGRYRWRNADLMCPNCNKPTIIKGKQEYGGGWVCFKKKGGCNSKFDDDATEIVGQPRGKVENDDICTLANTILKMAKKRALVDAAIALARCSDLFTQDVEDFADPGHGEEKPAPVAKLARQQRIKIVWEGAKLKGVTEDGFPGWVAKHIGSEKRSAQWTEADIARLEKALGTDE